MVLGIADLPEVFFTNDGVSSATASRWVSQGRIRRLAAGMYTTAASMDPALVVARNWQRIVAHELPQAVITDRSGPDPRPFGGYLFVVHEQRTRPLVLPGLTVVPRVGTGPQLDDLRLRPGLFAASPGRWLIDNTRRSRARDRALPRTLDRDELADAVDHLASTVGDRLGRIRDRARELGSLLGAGVHPDTVDRLLGAALGSRPDVSTRSVALSARQAGAPFDRARVDLFDRIAAHLAEHEPAALMEIEASPAVDLFEAYFSNFIEGTEFEVSEAIDIVINRKVPEQRSADAHDVLGTYQLIQQRRMPSSLSTDATEFIEQLQIDHSVLMQARPDKRPGKFKSVRNRVGGHPFVEPSHVRGTLAEGWRRVRQLDGAMGRALLAMFVVAEVHPFDDGNGRSARLVMNRELAAAGQQRIIIPTVYRNDYLRGLRGLSTAGATDSYLQIMQFARRWTASIDWSTIDQAVLGLTATNALLPPEAADEGRGLLLHW